MHRKIIKKYVSEKFNMKQTHVSAARSLYYFESRVQSRVCDRSVVTVNTDALK